MAESAILQPPVPKPRVSRQHHTPTQPEPDLTSTQQESPRHDEDLEADPPPYSSLLPPAEQDSVDKDHSDTEQTVVLRKKKKIPLPVSRSPDLDDEDDYENIDAHLDNDVQENMRRSDYINWVYVDSDGEEHEGGVGKVDGAVGKGQVHDRYAPSIKLHKHPALKKSQSNMDISTSDFEDGVRKQRPKNRAPPPPPGARATKEQTRDKPSASNLASSSSSGHKRSRSDLHLSGYSSNSKEKDDKVAVRQSSEQGRVAHKPPSNMRQQNSGGMPQGPPPRKPGPPVTHKQHPGGRLSPGQRRSGAGGESGHRGSRSNQRSPEASRREVPPEPVYASAQVKGQRGRDGKGQANGYAPLKNRSEERVYDQTSRGDKGAIYSRVNSQDNVKPKRHAPPPPSVAGKSKRTSPEEMETRRGNTPEYAVVNKLRPLGRGGDQSDPTSRRWGRTDSGGRVAPGDGVGPPKPLRTRRAQSIEDLSRLASETSPLDRVLPQPPQNSILSSMDVFTIELRKEREVSYGLVIVSGKARSGNGEKMIEGVFVQKVLPDSPSDNDGRIQSGDMLVEVGRKNLVGGSLEEAIQLLRESPDSVRLKIGRPDVSASVFTMDGEDEQPIYANEMVPLAERELQLKLEKAEIKTMQLEGEKEKALEDLMTLRQEIKEERENLQQHMDEMKQRLDDHKAESDTKNNELTQALASVTVGKTKSEQQLESLREEVEDLKDKLRATSDGQSTKELNIKLEEAKDEVKTLQERNTRLQADLAKEKEHSTNLQERLVIAESARDKEASEAIKLREKVLSQAEQVSLLKAELEQFHNLQLTPHSTTHHTLHVDTEPERLDTTYTKEADPHPSDNITFMVDDSEESEESDDAFDERVPSPVTPSPYLDFVPLEDKRHKERKEEKSRNLESTVKGESASKTSLHNDVVNTTLPQHDNDMSNKHTADSQQPGTSMEAEGRADPYTMDQEDVEDNNGDATVEFDAMELQTVVLDSSAALHKSKVGGRIRRKKPSKDHLKTMGSSTDLLDAFPELQEEPTLPVPAATESSNQTPPVPKPRPRPKKPVSTGEVKRPQAAPRHKQEDTQGGNSASDLTAPSQPVTEAAETFASVVTPSAGLSSHESHSPKSPKKKPMLPSPKVTPSHSTTSGSPLETTKAVDQAQVTHSSSSPLLKKKEPLMPSPLHSPKQLPKLPSRAVSKDVGKSPLTAGKDESESTEQPSGEAHHSENHPPKAHPRHVKQHSVDSHPTIELTSDDSIPTKDPSGLTFKEKLAMSQGSAPASPSKTKLLPPVPRKPKPGEDHHNEAHDIASDDREGSPFRRTRSFDKELEASPRRKKLPVGAINIMGNMGFLIAPHEYEERERSVTISTSEPGVRERNSLKRHLAGQEDSHQHQPEVATVHEEVDSEGRENKIKLPPKRPPPPRKLSNEPSSQQNDSHSSEEIDSDASPLVIRKEDQPEPTSSDASGDGEELNYNEVLTWSPDDVGVWLKKIGLGQHQQLFVDRVIQGYVLFDLDGHRLKGLGVDSHDDRSVFKREIKNLKPFADKQKKVLEKQRKEEKKNAKKKKK